ncbi:MAG TPA: HlyD family secretion protein [Methylomirabilota bacterium]|jgi:membrane fusion protein (multidrug efflux system)|nr:HlyD family secretion protein [Methylomirabilota bacterium]
MDETSTTTTTGPPDGHHDEAGVPAATPPPPALPPLYRRRGVIVAAAIVLVLLVIGGVAYWWYASGRVSTDDAFIEGRIVRISAQVSGQVARRVVDDNQRVKEGDLLVQLDDREYRALSEQAIAQAHAAEVAAENGAVDARRAQELFDRQLIAKQALDTAVATARTQAAQAEAARKQAAEAALKLSYTRITAPEPGRVTNRTVEEGHYVQVGQALMSIVPDELWVIANYKETQLTKLRPGQPATIRVDAYPGLVLRGHVDSVQAGTGAKFSLLPPENATGNYVKVVQRVPVKIVLDEQPPAGFALGPGMSVVPTINVR